MVQSYLYDGSRCPGGAFSHCNYNDGWANPWRSPFPYIAFCAVAYTIVVTYCIMGVRTCRNLREDSKEVKIKNLMPIVGGKRWELCLAG